MDKFNDRTRNDLEKTAAEAIANHGGPNVACVHYKWTCDHCGTRNMVERPNVLPHRGTCFACGMNSPIDKGGFLLMQSFPNRNGIEPAYKVENGQIVAIPLPWQEQVFARFNAKGGKHLTFEGIENVPQAGESQDAKRHEGNREHGKAN